jgi:hypothetical protein
MVSGMSRAALDLGLSIAGVRARLETAHEAIAALAERRYRAFVTEATLADWTIEVAEREEGLTDLEDVVIRRLDGPREYAAERHDFAATVDLARRRAHVALAALDDVALDAFLRVAWSLALVDAPGLMVHAASLARGGRAYLFCGRSGSGKTTVARLSPDAELLSDEISSVRLETARAACHGTPFFGDLAVSGRNVVRPLAGVYFLEHADRHARTRLTRRDALARLLPNVLFFAREPDLVARVLDIAGALVERVPCFRLAFRQDPGFWSVIDA